MLQNFIKNQRQKSFTLKLVFGSEQEALEAEDKFSSQIDFREIDIKKMQVAFGLAELKVYSVFNSVFVQYEFMSSKEAKLFERQLSDAMQADYSNIYDVFIIVSSEKKPHKEESPYRILLKLPKEAEIIKQNPAIKSLKIHGFEACEITRELALSNGKEVELVDGDISTEYLNVILSFNGKHKVIVPQKWLDIEEKTIKAIVNTKWMLDLDNLISINENLVVAKKGATEVTATLDVIKTDGQEVVLTKKNDKYVDVKRASYSYAGEMLIFKGVA